MTENKFSPQTGQPFVETSLMKSQTQKQEVFA